MQGEFVADLTSRDNTARTEQTIVLTEGMTFESGMKALEGVQDFALSIRKSVRVSSFGGEHRYIKCTWVGCPFMVKVYRQVHGAWRISSIIHEHRDCMSELKPTVRQTAAMPTFLSAVHADNSISRRALVQLIQERDGIDLSQHTRSVYRAKEKVLEIVNTELIKSYQLIHSYMDTLMKLNPGSSCSVLRDNHNRFLRGIIILEATARSMSANQNILGIDCSHSKCSNYHGVQMHLVGRDGNLENVTIAFALVESEDIACYTWFVPKVTDAGINLSGLPMFCDRDKALYSVANDLQLNLKFCTQHILRNVNSKFSAFKLATHSSLIWKLQAAYTKAEYDSTLGIIEINAGRNVRDYLAAIDP
ncbi:unnamed protein product [Phytophthora fragariaefolia]|uniref:Unnamed protein product n=1 Tax=Phytophthora fragariaefolia TaxID=1490495 RepID=A0A9W6YGA5_9STRA|nr:unnamed protein product [Phytophthora fragariaefolia]